MNKRYKLIKEYPHHKIGDVIKWDNRMCYGWKWELTGELVAIQFIPDNAPDWWEEIKEEKTLGYYQSLVYNDFVSKIGTLTTIDFQCHYKRIYWTEVLRVIAKDLSNSQLKQFCIGKIPRIIHPSYAKPEEYIVTADTSSGIKQGMVYFDCKQSCQKAIDLLGDNIKYLFE